MRSLGPNTFATASGTSSSSMRSSWPTGSPSMSCRCLRPWSSDGLYPRQRAPHLAMGGESNPHFMNWPGLRCGRPSVPVSCRRQLFECKDSLESHLAREEKELFSLPERMCLFDLTNTYFEGRASGNPNCPTRTQQRKTVRIANY